MKFLKTVYYFLFFVLALSSIFFVPRTLVIKEVSCQSQFGRCSGKISEKIKDGQNLSFLDSKSRLIETLSKEISVGNFSLQFEFPDSFKVHIVERVPKFAVQSLVQPEIALVDKNWLVISLTESTNLPSVYLYGSIPKEGDIVSDNLAFALGLVYDMNTSYQIKKGTIENKSFVVGLEGGQRVIFPLEGDTKVLVGALSLMLNQLNSESQDFKMSNVQEIDIRFKNPVIRLKN